MAVEGAAAASPAGPGQPSTHAGSAPPPSLHDTCSARPLVFGGGDPASQSAHEPDSDADATDGGSESDSNSDSEVSQAVPPRPGVPTRSRAPTGTELEGDHEDSDSDALAAAPAGADGRKLSCPFTYVALKAPTWR
jgi:hypothetical protein